VDDEKYSYLLRFLIFSLHFYRVSNFITYVGAGYDSSRSREKDSNGPLGSSSLPAIQKRSGVPVRSTTSGSSRELSDDEEVEGENELSQSTDPADVKRVRR
jgi:hypothetical protein